MDPISQVNPVLDALRKQLAENIERLRKSGRLPAAGGTAAPAAGRSAPPAESLEAALARKLAALDRRSPQARAAATRTFIETVLVAEFGQALLADPTFGVMLTELTATLGEDAAMREALDRLLADL